MKDRIRKFIQYKNLTPADLADRLGVQRSNVSHILNGRNKPGANFIEKLLNEYPEIDARWLMTGQGDMLVNRKEQIKGLFDQVQVPEAKMEILEPRETPKTEKTRPQEPMVKTETVTQAKKTERIIVFYTDKTFSEYIPE